MSFPAPTTVLCRTLNVIGLMMLVTPWLLKEPHERTIQRRLEALWVVIDDRKEKALAKAATFVQGVARLTARGFDHVFGDDIWSLRMVGMSVSFSSASFCLFFIILQILVPRLEKFGYVPQPPIPPSSLVSFYLFFVLWMIIYVCLGIFPIFVRNRWLLRAWALFVIIPVVKLCSFLVYAIYKGGHGEMAVGLSVIIVSAFFLSMACDVGYIAFTRWMLRRVSSSGHLLAMLTLIFGSAVLALALVVVPAFLGYASLKEWPVVAVLTAACGAIFNIVDLIVCSAIFATALLMLAHRVLWPLIEQLSYDLQRYRILQEKKRGLMILGIALLTLPTHTAGGVLRFLLAKLV